MVHYLQAIEQAQEKVKRDRELLSNITDALTKWKRARERYYKYYQIGIRPKNWDSVKGKKQYLALKVYKVREWELLGFQLVLLENDKGDKHDGK